MFETARALHLQGLLADARAKYLDILAAEADHFDALNMMGVLCGQMNDPARAVEYFDQAIAVAPDISGPYCNRGLALKQLNRLDAALASFDQSIALNDDDAVAHFSRGSIYQERGGDAQAAVSYDRALLINPEFAQAWFNRGVLLHQLGQCDEALVSFDQAINTKPDYAEAHANKAALLYQLNRFEDAVDAYDRAIEIAPDYAAAYLHRGNALKDLNQLDAALASFDKAIELQPNYAEAYSNRGVILYNRNRITEALDSYGMAIGIKPDSADFYFNRASILRAIQRFEEATADFAMAARLDAKIKFLPGAQLEAKLHVFDWDGYKAAIESIAAAVDNGQPVSHPFAFLNVSNSARLQKKCAKIWVRETCPEDLSLGPIAQHAPDERVRIGYFSADFREHPVSRLIAELIEIHDRARFEINAFSLAFSADDMSKRLRASFDQFLDVQHRSDREIAALARSLKIDIAIDLGGYTHNARPGIFALRAAPIQIGYLGYLGSMGAPYMDYLVADSTIICDDDYQHYQEKTIILPSYQANDSCRRIADRTFSRKELRIPPDGFVFCCFNTNYKITPAIFAAWMRILNRVEHSILFIYADNLSARRRFLQEVQRSGVQQQRIVFGERLELPDYLARYRTMDLFLDTLPYNAGTTASDALWAGLPVLTCMGDTFSGRIAASLLNAIDLPELIATTLDEYEEVAVELGSNPRHLAAIKEKLAANHRTKRLFNQQDFAVHLETGYLRAYRRYQNNLPPEHIVVAN